MSEEKQLTPEEAAALREERMKATQSLIEERKLTHELQKLNAEIAIFRAKELEAYMMIRQITNPNADVEEHIVTEDDLKNNPELEKQGIKVGDKVEIPKQ